LTSSQTSPIYGGQPVTFTATITTAGTPPSTVSFLDGSTLLGTASLNSAGQASFTPVLLAAGTDTITASCGGGTASITQVVNQATSNIILTSSSSLVAAGSSVTFTATVRGTGPSLSGVPTGSVTFLDGTTVLGTS